MIYKFRAILDTKDDVFRDIAIEKTATLEDLHNAIVNAFGFDGNEMASFYMCSDDWVQEEEEIPMFDTGDVPGEMRTMSQFILEDNLDAYHTKIIYVYDFLNMWTFLVELAAIEEKEDDLTYPALLFSHGEIPQEADDLSFEAEGGFDDDFDDDDIFSGDDSFDEMGFDENWN